MPGYLIIESLKLIRSPILKTRKWAQHKVAEAIKKRRAKGGKAGLSGEDAWMYFGEAVIRHDLIPIFDTNLKGYATMQDLTVPSSELAVHQRAAGYHIQAFAWDKPRGIAYVVYQPSDRSFGYISGLTHEVLPVSLTAAVDRLFGPEYSMKSESMRSIHGGEWSRGVVGDALTEPAHVVVQLMISNINNALYAWSRKSEERYAKQLNEYWSAANAQYQTLSGDEQEELRIQASAIYWVITNHPAMWVSVRVDDAGRYITKHRGDLIEGFKIYTHWMAKDRLGGAGERQTGIAEAVVAGAAAGTVAPFVTDYIRGRRARAKATGERWEEFERKVKETLPAKLRRKGLQELSDAELAPAYDYIISYINHYASINEVPKPLLIIAKRYVRAHQEIIKNMPRERVHEEFGPVMGQIIEEEQRRGFAIGERRELSPKPVGVYRAPRSTMDMRSRMDLAGPGPGSLPEYMYGTRQHLVDRYRTALRENWSRDVSAAFTPSEVQDVRGGYLYLTEGTAFAIEDLNRRELENALQGLNIKLQV
jgi:hypothetical protein